MDTIIIDSIPLVALGLQMQYTKCNGDTLNIHLPSEISSVAFNPSNNINYNNNNIQAAPAISIMYSIQATTTQGCLLLDTFGVKVNVSKPIHLEKIQLYAMGAGLNLWHH